MKNIIKSILKPVYQNKSNSIRYKLIHEPNSTLRIIFFLPGTPYPSGGVIVAHNHSDLINSLGFNHIKSEVMYPSSLNFSPNLFTHNSSFKRDFNFDVKKDFVILPEIMVARYAKGLADAGIKYGIHVQNGYLMDLELSDSQYTFDILKNAYENASIVIGNSSDTVENICFVFPFCAEKIIRSYFPIYKHKYKPIEDKENLITYMPRKLAKHSQHVLFFLKDKIPSHWKIEAIDGVSEQEVYDIFTRSKIFLSFSEFEGLAMPPAMAAMSGNKVIGYTGEANKEYFHLPCFQEIECGDIKSFVSMIIQTISSFDRGNERLNVESIDYLEKLFSKEKQEEFIRTLINKVKFLLQ